MGEKIGESEMEECKLNNGSCFLGTHDLRKKHIRTHEHQ